MAARKGGLVGERRQERRVRAAEMRANGRSVLGIAGVFGCSVSTVRELLEEAEEGETVTAQIAWVNPNHYADVREQVGTLRGLVREALSKGAERRCPWCWVVANKGKHAPDCRAIAALGGPSQPSGESHPEKKT